jgi:hypothetical protein
LALHPIGATEVDGIASGDAAAILQFAHPVAVFATTAYSCPNRAGRMVDQRPQDRRATHGNETRQGLEEGS